MCAVADLLMGPDEPRAGGDPRPPSGRLLGTGRHPVASGTEGSGVVFVELGEGSPAIGIRTVDPVGVPDALSLVNEPTDTPVSFSNPVIASLPDGGYAVAWSDYSIDGDELGVAVRRLNHLGEPLGATRSASGVRVGAQFDADIVVTADEVVVAWVDHASVTTAPDIRLQRFTHQLGLVGDEETLTDSPLAEGAVSLLATTDGSFAAAWRESSGGLETVVVKWRGLEYRVEPSFLPPDSDDRPTLVELDDGHLLVAFERAWEYEPGTGHVEYVEAAVVSESGARRVVSYPVAPLHPSYADAVEVEQRHVAAVRSGDLVYLSWTSSPIDGDPAGEETWIKELLWDAETEALDISQVEARLPRTTSHRDGDQRAVGIASAPYGTDSALVCAWTDYGRVFGAGSGAPDVVSELIPIPILRDDRLLEAGE
jgi:hypothetical protein